MSKRLFEVLDEMNLMDADGGARVEVCPNCIQVDWDKKSGVVFKMGASGGLELFTQVERGEKIPILLLVDKKLYNELSDKS